MKKLYSSYRATVFNMYSIIGVSVAIVFTIMFIFARSVIDLSYELSNLLGISVTGLSFTFALFVAIRSIYDNKNLGHLYLISKTDEELSNVFKEVFSPFIWTSFLWLVIVGVAIGSMMISFSSFLNVTLIKYMKGIILIIVFVAALNIFGLVQDIIHDAENKAKRVSEKEVEKVLEKSDK